MSGRKVGSVAWLRDTNGALSASDQLALAGIAVRAQVELSTSLLKRTFGLPPNALDSDSVANVKLPDTTAAKSAYEEAAAVSSPELLGHCMRTYFWGRMLAAQEQRDFDDEAYYIAALFHDYGLTDNAQNAPCQCFTLTSVEAANEFTQKTGWDQARADIVAEAIALHINVGVFPADGPEAYLLHHATTMDCTGIRLWEFSRGAREAVLTRHPRGSFTTDVNTAFQREMARCPGTRMRFLYRYLLFGTLMRFGPLKGD